MVVTSANHSVLVARAIQGTFRHDLGQTLTIDGKEILTDDNAGRTMTTTGLFIADQNANGQTELGAAFSAPFVVGTDVPCTHECARSCSAEVNGAQVADVEGQVGLPLRGDATGSAALNGQKVAVALAEEGVVDV